MPEEIAFAALYQELGLGAECSLDEFRHAYRRRASQLHPDRSGADSDTQRLQRLNVLYDSALEFHHLHGHLPGARAVPETRRIETAQPPVRAQPQHATEPSRRRRRYLISASVLALLLYWLGSQRGAPPTLDPAGPGDEVAPGLLQPQAPDLAIGMDQALARSTLGRPDSETATRWDYGASWVEFRCGKVSGWYSSPLRPLHVAQDSAQAPSAHAQEC